MLDQCTPVYQFHYIVTLLSKGSYFNQSIGGYVLTSSVHSMEETKKKHAPYSCWWYSTLMLKFIMLFIDHEYIWCVYLFLFHIIKSLFNVLWISYELLRVVSWERKKTSSWKTLLKHSEEMENYVLRWRRAQKKITTS